MMMAEKNNTHTRSSIFTQNAVLVTHNTIEEVENMEIVTL